MSLIETIKQATCLINPKNPNQPQFPQITIPPFARRSEGKKDPYSEVINESRPPHLESFFSEKDSTISFCTHPASPHTPELIEIQGISYPAHLLVWWYEKNSESRKYPTIIDLARMNSEKRRPFLIAIASEIKKAVMFLKNEFQIPDEELHHYIEIYGLGGHTKPDERKKTGLSRGAQSHPMGHINVVYHPYEKYKELAQKGDTSPRQFLKQVGPMDTVVFNRWKSFLSVIATEIISSSTNPHLLKSVKSEENYEKQENSISFYEGLTITFNQPQNMIDTLETICQIIAFFDGLYLQLRVGYETYYQHIGDGDKILSIIKKELIENIKLYFNQQIPGQKIIHLDDFINQIVDFSLNFHPTYQQLVLWQNSDEVSQATKDRLNSLQKTYEKIQETIKDPEKKQRLIKWLEKFYSLTSFEAEAYLQFFIDMTSSTADDQWRSIEFTWADQLSLSYLLDKYIVDENDGTIKVSKLTIAPRFFTNKGVFEDLAGMGISRPQGI